jgi:hypothetical protein
MNVHTSPFSIRPDTSLAALLDALAPRDDRSLVFEHSNGRIAAGYHVTEIKAGSFVTLDCGGNPDAWQETILQVEDIPAGKGQSFMTVAKFHSILNKVDRKVRLNGDARVTFEVSRPGEAMRVYDVAGVTIDAEEAVVRLAARPAICKPRHREAQAMSGGCCAPAAAESSGACCA